MYLLQGGEGGAMKAQASLHKCRDMRELSLLASKSMVDVYEDPDQIKNPYPGPLPSGGYVSIMPFIKEAVAH